MKMWSMLKGNIRRQFKATLHGGARKGGIGERPKNVLLKKVKSIIEQI